MQRAYNEPLIAHFGYDSLPDPQNITHHSVVTYNQASWAATVEMVGAHPLGGLRFTSFRSVLCCAVLCCAVLCCAVLCCAVLCCAVH